MRLLFGEAAGLSREPSPNRLRLSLLTEREIDGGTQAIRKVADKQEGAVQVGRRGKTG